MTGSEKVKEVARQVDRAITRFGNDAIQEEIELPTAEQLIHDFSQSKNLITGNMSRYIDAERQSALEEYGRQGDVEKQVTKFRELVDKTRNTLKTPTR